VLNPSRARQQAVAAVRKSHRSLAVAALIPNPVALAGLLSF